MYEYVRNQAKSTYYHLNLSHYRLKFTSYHLKLLYYHLNLLYYHPKLSYHHWFLSCYYWFLAIFGELLEKFRRKNVGVGIFYYFWNAENLLRHLTFAFWQAKMRNL